MIRLYFAALPLALLSSPALAEPTCKDALTPVPMWQVAKTFEDAGGSISAMKTNDGCYEIYGHQADKRVEVFFDPNTGKELERD